MHIGFRLQTDKLGFDGRARSTLGSPFGGAGTALAVTERALSAPFGGTSPIGRGKAPAAHFLLDKFPFTRQLSQADKYN